METAIHKLIRSALLSYCALTLLLTQTGCTPTCGWRIQKLEASTRQQSAMRLYFQPANTCHGLGLELIHTTKGVEGYIDVYYGKMKASKLDHMIALTLSCNGSVAHYFGRVHMGGQRLKLDARATAYIISALLQHSSITIECNGYHAEISGGKEFIKLYKRL